MTLKILPPIRQFVSPSFLDENAAPCGGRM